MGIGTCRSVVADSKLAVPRGKHNLKSLSLPINIYRNVQLYPVTDSLT